MEIPFLFAFPFLLDNNGERYWTLEKLGDDRRVGKIVDA